MANNKKTAQAEDDVLIVPAETDPTLARPETVVIDGKEVSTEPDDLGDYRGRYKHRSYKEPFALKIVEDDTHGRTHHLKNTDYYWAGTKDEFKQQFEK
jgi:hypothetical protein